MPDTGRDGPIVPYWTHSALSLYFYNDVRYNTIKMLEKQANLMSNSVEQRRPVMAVVNVYSEVRREALGCQVEWCAVVCSNGELFGAVRSCVELCHTMPYYADGTIGLKS